MDFTIYSNPGAAIPVPVNFTAMLELTEELRQYLKASINRGFLSFTDDTGIEYRVPLTEERRRLCLEAIISGWWDVERLITI